MRTDQQDPAEAAEWPIERQARLIGEGNRVLKEQRERIHELGAALLWLRNHYDLVASDHVPAEKYRLVLTVIDGLLDEPGTPNAWLTLADLRAFRDKHLRAVEEEAGMMFVEGRRGRFAAPLVVNRDLTKDKWP